MTELRQASQNRQSEAESSASNSAGFAFGSGLAREPRSRFPLVVWVVAALVVAAVAGSLIYFGNKKPVAAPKSLQPEDAYAANLPLTRFAMSESANLSGGKLTYLDGRVQNTGSKTVTAVTVQVVFANDEAMPPGIDTVPLALIGMKQPYIDVQSLGATPLKPQDDKEFRLTFETVPENWNQQMPRVRVIRVESR